MKFIDIYQTDAHGKEIQFINMLIKKQIFNDDVFENHFITADVILDSPVQVFYRTFWEKMYLKRKESTIIMRNKTAKIKMSISECIQYLQEITPPNLRDLLTQNMKSVDAIHKMMVDFLKNEDDPQHPYYLTKFYEVFHMNLFNNAWIPDYKKIAFARNIVKDEILCLVDASTESIDMICNGSHNISNNFIQVTFHVDTDEAIEKLYSYLWHTGMTITGLQCSEIGLFVSAYSDTIDELIAEIIKNTYSHFMKK